MKKAIFIALMLPLLSKAQTGKVGINTKDPTETLHINGTARVSDLPLNGTASAINTKVNGTVSTAKDQTFTAVKTVVVDANGVLGTISGLPVIELPPPPEEVYKPIRYCSRNTIGDVFPGPTHTMTFADSGYIFEWKDTGIGKFTLYVRRTPKWASQTRRAKSTWWFSNGAVHGSVRGDFTITGTNESVFDASFQTSTMGKVSLIVAYTGHTFNIDFTTLNPFDGTSKVMNICIEQTTP
ncbi:hypothetical protein [Riemerella anatipestifer]|uniref:hypothetical protein n=1 Tax=Riemerella anatipestifer TaxID=34085 RepID=UPI00129EC016|nr:hypothetical protein [Riemerella anatipestifer]